MKVDPQVVKKIMKEVDEVLNAKCELHNGDIVRFTDPSNCNTIYRVLNVKLYRKGEVLVWRTKPPVYTVTLTPAFGLFKQDYKVKKTTRLDGGPLRGDMIKLDLLQLLEARNQFDLFIQQETKRLSGET